MAMEASPVSKKNTDFESLSISQLSSAPSPPLPDTVSASFLFDSSGRPQLRLSAPDAASSSTHLDLQSSQLFKVGPLESLFVTDEHGGGDVEDGLYDLSDSHCITYEAFSKELHIGCTEGALAVLYSFAGAAELAWAAAKHGGIVYILDQFCYTEVREQIEYILKHLMVHLTVNNKEDLHSGPKRLSYRAQQEMQLLSLSGPTGFPPRESRVRRSSLLLPSGCAYGPYKSQLVEHFFQSLVNTSGMALHIRQKSFSRAFKIGFRRTDESEAFHSEFEHWKHRLGGASSGEPLENGSLAIHKSKFEDKIEATSAKMYFHYYGQLLHQQNMLQDYVRTGTYYAAIIENRADFHGRVVVDVGAGSGILSLFAAQAGAKHVYAVEASEMAEYARRLIAGNPSLGQRITIIKGKIEDIELPEKADILISEPMGTLLVNERMLETYVIARDRFLVSDGKMFPSTGRIHLAPFSDEYLYVEIANKALFWQQQNYYGVDLTPLYGAAFQGYYSQPVVDAFDPRLLVSPYMSHTLDFTRIKEEELYEIEIPLNFVASVGTRVHGLACWFDVLFNGSSVQRWLSTAPGSPTTHWYQLRCVLAQPIYVMAGQEITGRFHLVAHSAQSYTIYLTMSAKTWGPGASQGEVLQTSSCKLDLKEPYYRLSQLQPYMTAQDQQPHQQLVHSQDSAGTGVTIQSQQNEGDLTQ